MYARSSGLGLRLIWRPLGFSLNKCVIYMIINFSWNFHQKVFTLTISFIVLNASIEFVLIYRPHPVLNRLSYCFLVNHQITGGPVGPHKRKRHMNNGRPFWWYDDVTGSTIICPLPYRDRLYSITNTGERGGVIVAASPWSTKGHLPGDDRNTKLASTWLKTILSVFHTYTLKI